MAALPGDIVRVRVPTPFKLVPEVNCYLLLGARPTLLDTGPGFAAAAAAIEAALARHGLRPADLDLVLLSHHHCDHAGLSSWLRERGAGSVAAIAPVADFLRDIGPDLDGDEAFATALLGRHGFEPGLARAIVAVEADKRRFHRSLDGVERLQPGVAVAAGDRELVVHARPGHSPFDTVFHDEGDGLLLLGDHLLAAFPSTPYLHLPPGETDPAAAARRDRVSPLPRYLEALRSTAALDASLGLPGHGEPFERPRELAAARLDGYEARAERLLGELARAGEPLSAAALIDRLWPRLPVEKAYVVFSEALGLLEVLCERGRAGREPRPDSVRFHPCV